METINVKNSDDNNIHEHEHDGGEELKISEIIMTIIGIVILVISFVISKKLSISPLLLNIMYGLSYICIGYTIFFKAIKHLFKKDMFDENLLMTIATVGAFFTNDYIEGVIVILLYKIGEFLEDKATENSKKKIKESLSINVSYANLKLGNEIKKIEPQNVKIGDIIIVKSGERVPLDGIVINGNTNIDTSSLTGESKPVSIKENDKILSGVINLSNVIEIKVTNTYENSTSTKIMKLITEAVDNKSKTENFISRFSKIYTPIVILIALILLVILPVFFNIPFVTALREHVLIFLVVSCPCALVISVPLGFFIGIGTCSKNGILVKGSNYLDILSSVKKVAFDKTGTLTKGEFEITNICNKSNLSDDKLLEIVALCELFSNHYIAKSIVKSYNKKLDKSKIIEHSEIAGYGIVAKIEDMNVIVGNEKLLNKNNIEVDKQNKVGTIVHVAINNEYAGNIILSDNLKDGVEELINNLKKIGIKETILLTGDKKDIANDLKNKINIDRVYSELLPKDKVDIIKNIKEKDENKLKIAYVGDGINDSPVLASADVGISMGHGSDLAIETSDIVLMTDEPHKIVDCIKISKNTKNIVMQNIIFAISVKIIVLILSTFGSISMWLAIFADVGVSLIAILNCMRIFRKKI